MKNWIRIFLLCFVLVGGTTFFAFHSLNLFNEALDDLGSSSLAIAKIPPIPISDKTNKTNEEKIPTSTPETVSTSTLETVSTTTLETVSTSTPPTDLKIPFIFPEKNNEVFVGCTYKLLFKPSTAIRLLETTLIDAGTIETIDPVVSGLTRENKIETNSQSLDWKVGVVVPGDYYIKVSDINSLELENYSKVFTINKIPKVTSVEEIEKICQESNGSF